MFVDISFWPNLHQKMCGAWVTNSSRLKNVASINFPEVTIIIITAKILNGLHVLDHSNTYPEMYAGPVIDSLLVWASTHNHRTICTPDSCLLDHTLHCTYGDTS